MILLLPIPIALWTVVGVLGSVVMGIFYAFIWPVMETFKAISKPGLHNNLFGCIMDGTWSNVWGACTIVRDFVDFSFHSYFSMMDEWLEAKDNEKPLELKKILPKKAFYVIASVSLFDEYTNDFVYMREGSCFPRPQYRAKLDQNFQLLPQKGLHEQLEVILAKRPMMANTTEKIKSVKAVTVWDYFFKGSELTGKEHIRDGAIGIQDLEHWQHSKNKIVNIGIPAYTFLQCFLQSIKSGSTGLLMSDSVEVTDLNRPEGRVFDWLYEPMCVMKEQIKSLNLLEAEELYLFKLCLYCGDMQRVDFWHNGRVPPEDDIKKAQLEAISRRLQGFCLTLSRLPTFRQRLSDVVRALMQDALQQLGEGTKVYGSAMV